MRKMSGPIRVGGPQRARALHRAGAAQYARSANRYATVKRVGRTGGLVFLAVLFWLIFYQNLPNNLQGMADNGPVVLSNQSDRLIKITMILMSLYVIATRWALARQLAKSMNAGMFAFLALAVLSAAWSIDPSATFLRFVSLANIVLLCFAISLAGWHRRCFQQTALPPLMFILLVSLVVGILAPDRITEAGTDISQKDAWHGITHSKNEFGMMASIAVIICVNRWLSGERGAYWAMAGAAVSFTCLVLSRSNTALFATVVGVFFMVLVMRVPLVRQRFSSLVVISIAALILLYELATQNMVPGVSYLLSPITSLTGKDTTFSARTVIWDIVKDHIQWAPYLGTGYGAYWQPVPSSPSYVFVSRMNFYPTEAHNGYLDVVNDLGFVGLICLLAFLFWFIRQALQLMRFDRAQAVLYLALLFQEMVMNMSESEWFSRGSTFAVLLLATVCLSRSLVEARLHAQPARPAAR